MRKVLIRYACFFILVLLAMPVYADKVLAEIEYFYSDDGTLIGKALNGKRVHFEYDLRGQLLAVKDSLGKDLERYTYDPAGNRLSKTINGVMTTYTYDKANQLVTSTVNGVTSHYKYDAAGRMIQAGDKTYIYNGRNKVSEVRQNGKTIAKFEYNIDGQIAKAIYGDKVEEFMWDGLALIWRSGVTYINEPYITGGNPVMAGDDVLFNDMLGSTLAVNGNPVEMTSFGETEDKNVFYTGKPMIDELGYSFLFRDYNPQQGKWTSSDPLGYPDGWNNLAYGNNKVFSGTDLQGAVWVYDTHNVNFEATTRKTFSSGNDYYIVKFPAPDWWYMVIYQVNRAEYIEQMVQASCPNAEPYKYTPPANSYNVSVNVSWVKSVYNYGDAFNGNGGIINVDVYSVESTWRITGTYQTRRWVAE